MIVHGIASAVLLFLFLVYKCPSQWLFGIACPTCGVTRALSSAMAMDFKAAFAHHPLFPVVPPLVLYIAHRTKLKIPKLAETIILSLAGVAFLGVYVVRYWL